MAKDDYHVIVYQILSYLYVQLKSGKPVQLDMIVFPANAGMIPIWNID